METKYFEQETKFVSFYLIATFLLFFLLNFIYYLYYHFNDVLLKHESVFSIVKQYGASDSLLYDFNNYIDTLEINMISDIDKLNSNEMISDLFFSKFSYYIGENEYELLIGLKKSSLYSYILIESLKNLSFLLLQVLLVLGFAGFYFSQQLKCFITNIGNMMKNFDNDSLDYKVPGNFIFYKYLVRVFDLLNFHHENILNQRNKTINNIANLMNRERFFLDVWEMFPVPLIIIDNKSYYIEMYNKLSKDYLFQESGDVFKRSPIISRYKAEVQSLEGNANINLPYIFTETDGIRHVVKICIRNLHEYNKTIILLFDETEVVEAQNRAMITHKMLAFSNFVTQIAHELNNPLSAILIAKTNLEKYLDVDDKRNINLSEKYNLDKIKLKEFFYDIGLRNFTEAIRVSSDKMADIIYKVLYLYGKGYSDFTNFDVKNFICEANKIASSSLNHDLAYVNFDVFIDVAPHTRLVYGQKNQIQFALAEILKNSYEAYSDDKKLKVIKISAKNLNTNKVVIEVQDFGDGIPDSYLDRVKEPFFTSKNQYVHKGLGMYLAFVCIVFRNRGGFELYSKEGFGTKVIIELPVADNSAS